MTRVNNERVPDEQIKLGRIVFTNVWPIFYQFPPPELEESVLVHTKTPAQLNAGLLSGELDAASISSFAYALQAEELVLLPELSVSAFGAVGSLFLFTKQPLHEVEPERVALTNASATTVHLLKIILAKRYGYSPEYVNMTPNLDMMMNTCDAALLIGDDAIAASWSNQADPYYTYDLAALWTEWTGLGMTFAVWAARKEWVERLPEKADVLHRALLRSKMAGVRIPNDLLSQALREVGGTEAFWKGYFHKIIYDFGSKEQQGLERYFQYCYELGFLDRIPPLHVWRNPNMMQVNE